MTNAALHRRNLHMIPELGNDLPETRAYILSVLSGIPCEISESAGAIFAYFDNGSGRSCALRADMDALPVYEQTNTPYSSTREGKMHACGHDGHTAMLLALSQKLPGIIASLPRSVLLVFQPAEETTGGARDIIGCGEMQRRNVDRVFGCHIWPGLEAGKAYAKSGCMMAGSHEVNVDIAGKSVHIANTSSGADALLAAALFLPEVYESAAKLDEIQPALIRFGYAKSGTVRNALSGSTRLEGSMRFFNKNTEEELIRILDAAAKKAQRATGCTFSISFSEGYPPLINDNGLYLAARGTGLLPLETPAVTSDDFAVYGEHFPACFFFLGAGNTPPLHSPHFDFDEAILDRGISIYERLIAVS